ncbi:MAG TPA: hypothetical protein VJN42_06155 [Candidatus Acidoferrum sp.]|nr:hypothetical protein [Candidatus Acidoferrum sp.]
MNAKKKSAISRREFARGAALASAASFVPAAGASLEPHPPFPPQEHTQLSPESQAEAEARYQSILAAYNSRFSDEQKKELRRLSFDAQPSLDRLRSYPLDNADGPALYLKPLVEREKKPAASPSSSPSSPAKP